MTYWLERILIWAAARLPDSRAVWIEDLRHEAQHIPAGMRRIYFLWGGVQAAMGEILRVSVGPRRLGQALFAGGGVAMCCVGLVAAVKVEDPVVKSAFYGLLVLYAIAASLAVLNLKRLKQFSFGASFCLAVLWVFLGAQSFLPADLPIVYLKALSIEASVVMMSLFIGASYLAWVETPDHA